MCLHAAQNVRFYDSTSSVFFIVQPDGHSVLYNTARVAQVNSCGPLHAYTLRTCTRTGSANVGFYRAYCWSDWVSACQGGANGAAAIWSSNSYGKGPAPFTAIMQGVRHRCQLLSCCAISKDWGCAAPKLRSSEACAQAGQHPAEGQAHKLFTMLDAKPAMRVSRISF